MRLTGSKNTSFPASVTIEAALALPVFIFILLSFAFLIMVLRTHEVVHSSMINAANTMAMQYYTIAGLDKVSAGNNGAQTNRVRLSDNPSSIMNEFYFNLEKYNYSVYSDSYDDYRSYADIAKSIENPISMIDLYKQYLLHEFYKRADISYGKGDFSPDRELNTGGAGDEGYPGFNRKKWVDNMLNGYQIIGGFDGIKFAADSSAATAWQSDFPNPSINGGNYMTIKVRYEIKIPFPIQTIGKIPVSHCIRVRLWGYGDD